MVTQVNGLIGNQLCSDYPGMVLSTATSSLSSTDNLVRLLIVRSTTNELVIQNHPDNLSFCPPFLCLLPEAEVISVC